MLFSTEVSVLINLSIKSQAELDPSLYMYLRQHMKNRDAHFCWSRIFFWLHISSRVCADCKQNSEVFMPLDALSGRE